MDRRRESENKVKSKKTIEPNAAQDLTRMFNRQVSTRECYPAVQVGREANKAERHNSKATETEREPSVKRTLANERIASPRLAVDMPNGD